MKKNQLVRTVSIKTTLIKTASILISIFMLVSLLAGCGSTSNPAAGKSSPPPEEKFDLMGQEFKIASYYPGFDPQKTSPTYEEEVNLEKSLEKKYNCKFKYFNFNGDYNGFSAQYVAGCLAGAPIADLCIFCTETVWPNLIIKNTCLPLDDYFNFNTKMGWNSVTAQQGYYKGKHYMTWYDEGNANPPVDIFFNKKIIASEALPDLYELAKNKQWTWDKMLEVAQKTTKDTNGDGKIDQWGYGSIYSRSISILEAVNCNGAYFTKFVNDKEVVAFDDPAAIEAIQFAYDMIHTYNVVDPAWSSEKVLKEFTTGKLALMNAGLYMGATVKSAGMNDYGVLPFPIGPKANNYIYSTPDYNAAVIPVGVKNPKLSALILKEKYGPHKWSANIDIGTVNETNVCDQESVEIIRMTKDSPIPANDLLSFPFIASKVCGGYETFLSCTKSSASAWVESLKAGAQKSIDDVWAAAK